jgi:two-component system sensor histidine kinase TtrS
MIGISQSGAANKQSIRIGVLSHRGDDVTQQMWSPTASYLTKTLPAYQFEIVPLDFDEVEPAVKDTRIHFLLVNSGIYVNMEVRHRISRIVTLNNRFGDEPLNVFGGVIFTRKDRNDINHLEDIKGKRFLAVDKTSLGGFQMAWGEMDKLKINPYKNFSVLEFAGTHDKVVMAIINGQFDVATVRTNILEKMAADGDIKLDDFKIINQFNDKDFPFLRSTPLYPEWPFSKLQQTSNLLAQQVAVALLNMPAYQATGIHQYAGWTVPLDYQLVHDLFKQLKLPPYEDRGRFTLLDAISKYWQWLLMALMFLLMMTIMSSWVVRLNRQLKKSKLSLEYQHDLVLNSVCDGIYGVDLKGNCTFINLSMKKITGWRAADMIGHNQHKILHHSHEDGTPHPEDKCPVYLTFRDNQPRFIEDDIFWKKDGSNFPVEYSSTPMLDHKGSSIGSVVVFRDISERKKAEEEARKHLAELAHMARLNTMGEMASGIAHELNQPLTAIATNAFASIQMLDSGRISKEKLADILETIGMQAERSGEIIRQLRQFVRKEQPERSLINLNHLIEEVLLLIKPEARKATVFITRHLDKRIKKVKVQPIQIEQVVLNLVKNAIEAVNGNDIQNRKLLISTEMAGNHAVIVSVQDTGPGIDKEIRAGLFDPFITSKDNGLGLGLSISQGIIEAHRGNIYLDSTSARGSIFRFTLPVEREVLVHGGSKN